MNFVFELFQPIEYRFLLDTARVEEILDVVVDQVRNACFVVLVALDGFGDSVDLRTYIDVIALDDVYAYLVVHLILLLLADIALFNLVVYIVA